MTPAQSSSPGRGATCREDQARFAVGQPYTAELAERARRQAGASVVRVIKPGEVYTMEFRPDRLNLELDESGKVRRVRCG